MSLCFLHGLDSSPFGTKARLIKTHFPGCYIPSLPPDIHRRLQIVKRELQKPTIIIGSSLGGLTALMFAVAHPQLTAGLLLLAPAVGFCDGRIFSGEQKRILQSLYVPEDIPTIIIAGTHDDVIPLASIRSLVRRSPNTNSIELLEVDDGHDLHQHLELMIESIERLRVEVSK